MGRKARISALICFRASSSTMRMTASADDSTSRMVPRPAHLGQTMPLVSPREGRRRWRDISIKPKREILPIWILARSSCSAVCIRCSTCRWFLAGVMSMKSMTISPPMSRRRSWRQISSAASRLVLSAVSSMSAPRVAREELISTETSASVGSMAMEPPDGRRTSRPKADSICPSIW